jgi:serine/threonine-protein kinase
MTNPLPEPFKVNGRYEITEKPLGEGSTGVVYKAYDTVTKRFVALKTIWADAAPESIGLFEREWTVLGRLSHPNIVDVLDTGEWSFNGKGRPYFVMPLLPGATLEHLIETASPRLTVERTIDILSQACRGLQAAHDQSLVHGGIKPGNIFVLEDDAVKIIDFGVAQTVEASPVAGLKGVSAYAAPEQVEMKPATPLSDIFSLGVVCYQTLTGRKPFERESEAGTGEAIRTYIPPPASEINPVINEMVSRTVHKAMAKLPGHRFANAREFGDTLQKALRNEPIERFEPAKIQPRIERVKRAYSEGDYQFAQEILSELESEGHLDPHMPVLRTQIEQATRENNIRQLLENARIRMDEQEYPLALQKVASVLRLDPENRDAHTLRSHIERLRGETQVESWFRVVREQRDNNQFGQARQGLQEILKLDTANTQARQLLGEIEQSEQEMNRIRDEKQRLYEGAVGAYRDGEISTALSGLERALAMAWRGTRSGAPDLDARCQSFYNQVRAERDAARNAYTEGRKYILDRNVPRALEICGEYLERHPGDPMFQALKLEAEELERQELAAAVAEVNRRAEAEPDIDKKLNILKEAVEKYPEEPHFRSSMKLVRDRRDLVSTIVGRARQYEERGMFYDAEGQWDILRNIYPLFPGLDFEIERLARRKEEQVQGEAKARWMEQIDAHLNAADYAKAHAKIGEALGEFPQDQELIHAQSIAEQGLKRGSEGSALLKQGQDLCFVRQYEEGLVALRKAERLDPRNGLARAALIGGLVAHARELMPKDWHAAEPLVKEALDLEPGDPAARGLLSVLDDHRRQDAIANILAGAKNYQDGGHISDALQLVERGLAQYPSDSRLTQLAESLRAPAAPPVEEAPPVPEPEPEPVAATPEPAATTSAVDALRPKLVPVLPGASLPVPASKPRTELIVRPPTLLQRRPPAPKPLSLPPAPRVLDEPGFRGPVWAVAGVVALALIIAAGIYSLTHKPNQPVRETAPASSADARGSAPAPILPRMRPVLLESNVAGTSFSEDGKTLAAASELSAGNHAVEASHEGYLPDLKVFSIDAAATSPLSVKFELRRALARLRLISPIANGRLVLDELETLNLQAGSVSKEDLPLGPHTVKVYDKRREIFSFAFEARPNQLPVLITPLATQPVAGAVIVSMGGAAKVYTTPGLRAAAGQQPGQALQAVPPLGLDLAGSPEKPARFLLEGSQGVSQQQSADSSAFPVLTVKLAGVSEPALLALTSNVADCGISVDGKPLKDPLSGTARSIPLDPGVHPIRLSCPGYRDMEQIATIKDGDAGPYKLDFAMTANPVRRAVFTLAGALPDTAVLQNQVRIGTVGADGTFSKEIDPGSYTFEWRKPGFEPRKESRVVKAGESLRLDGTLTPSTGSLVVRVNPDAARIVARHEGDSGSISLLNNTPLALAAGSYRVTAEAAGYREKSEIVQVANGKFQSLAWDLEKNAVAPAAVATALDPVHIFENGDSWQPSREGSGWWVHSGSGYSSLRSSTGTFSFDFLKKKGGARNKKINILADCGDHDNCIVYALDGHNLTSKVIAGGQTVQDEKKAHGMDSSSSYHLLFEMSPDAIVVKNSAGVILSSVERTNPRGKLAVQDDNPLNIN